VIVSYKVVDRIQERVLEVIRSELGIPVEPEDIDHYVTEILERELGVVIDYKEVRE